MFACTFDNNNNNNNNNDNIDLENLIIDNAIITNISATNIEISANLTFSTGAKINGDSIEQFGGGAVKLQDFFNYYFINKPLQPVYISGGSYDVPTNLTKESYNLGNYDLSSGRYNSVTQQIELRWQLPPQKPASFNFTSPRDMSNNSIDLDIDNWGIINKTELTTKEIFNKIPYYEKLIIQVSTDDGIKWHSFDQGALGSNNRYIPPMIQGANIKPSSDPNHSADISLIDSKYIYNYTASGGSIIKNGSTDEYKFRIQLFNSDSSSIPLIIPGPDYDGISITVSYGVPNAPYGIGITFYYSYENFNENFTEINISGGLQGSTVVETNLGTTFDDIFNNENLNLTYSFKLKISAPSTSLNLNFMNNYNNMINYIDPNFNNSTTDPKSVTYDISINNTSKRIENNYLKSFPEIPQLHLNMFWYNMPEYEFEISEFYMKHNQNTQKTQILNTAYPIKSSRSIPTRNNISSKTTRYKDFFNISPNLATFTTDDSTISTYILNSNIFIRNTTSFTIPSNTKIYFLRKDNPNDYIKYTINNIYCRNSGVADDKGTALKDKDLCYFKFTATNTITTLSHKSINLTTNTTNNIYSSSSDNGIFSIEHSGSKDAAHELLGSNFMYYILQGWFLGVDLIKSEVMIHLTSDKFTDFVTNYNPWIITFGQYDSLNNQSLGTYIQSFYITEKLDDGNISIVPTMPVCQFNTSSTKFFGLNQPSNTNFLYCTVNINITNVNAYWKESNDTFIAKLRLLYNGNTVINSEQIIDYDSTATDYIRTKTLYINKSNSSLNSYSRPTTQQQQFSIKVTDKKNNVGYSGENSDSTINIPDKIWWDFTWYDTNFLPNNFLSVNNQYKNGDFFMKVGKAANEYNISYDHSSKPLYNMMMWANGAFRAFNSDSYNPFVDYSVYVNQPGSNTADYSSLKESGENIATLYNDTNNSFIAHFDPNIEVKFIMIKFLHPGTPYRNFNVDIKNVSNQSLTLGIDYVMEMNDANIQEIREWRNCQKIINSTVSDSTACYNITNPLHIEPIKTSPVATDVIYLRIGLPIKDSNLNSLTTNPSNRLNIKNISINFVVT